MNDARYKSLWKCDGGVSDYTTRSWLLDTDPASQQIATVELYVPVRIWPTIVSIFLGFPPVLFYYASRAIRDWLLKSIMPPDRKCISKERTQYLQ
jgi:hypothetical protein